MDVGCNITDGPGLGCWICAAQSSNERPAAQRERNRTDVKVPRHVKYMEHFEHADAFVQELLQHPES